LFGREHRCPARARRALLVARDGKCGERACIRCGAEIPAGLQRFSCNEVRAGSKSNLR